MASNRLTATLTRYGELLPFTAFQGLFASHSFSYFHEVLDDGR